MDDIRKCCCIAVLALLFALVAYSSIQSPDIAYEVIVNNTNLAPTIDPSTPGTGERVSGNLYWANDSAIDLHVFSHAVSVADVAEVILYVNGTIISQRSGRPLGSAETAYRGIDTTIPKGANYSVVFSKYHHYEWREYPILSGKNGTLSINQTIINNFTNITSGIGSNFNSTYANTTLQVNGNASNWNSTYNASYAQTSKELQNNYTNFVPTGTITQFGSVTSIPSGYLLSDGSAVSRTTYANLFALIGTNYGIGDGTTTFNLPQMFVFQNFTFSNWATCCGSTGSILSNTNTTGGQSIPYTYVTPAGSATRYSAASGNQEGVWSIHLRTNSTNGAYEYLGRFYHTGNDVTSNGMHFRLSDSPNSFTLDDDDAPTQQSVATWAYTKVADGNWHWVNISRVGNFWTMRLDGIDVANLTAVPVNNPTYIINQHNENR